MGPRVLINGIWYKMTLVDQCVKRVDEQSKLDLALQSVQLADGSTAEREVVVHRGAVALLPMVDRDHVRLVKNFRHAIRQTLLEVPAGSIDEGETPDRTAERELAEETGFRAGRISSLHDWFVTPGVMTERMFLYLCEDLVPGPTDHQPDERQSDRSRHAR